jgi:hypothetical protein
MPAIKQIHYAGRSAFEFVSAAPPSKATIQITIASPLRGWLSPSGKWIPKETGHELPFHPGNGTIIVELPDPISKAITPGSRVRVRINECSIDEEVSWAKPKDVASLQQPTSPVSIQDSQSQSSPDYAPLKRAPTGSDESPFDHTHFSVASADLEARSGRVRRGVMGGILIIFALLAIGATYFYQLGSDENVTKQENNAQQENTTKQDEPAVSPSTSVASVLPLPQCTELLSAADRAADQSIRERNGKLAEISGRDFYSVYLNVRSAEPKEASEQRVKAIRKFVTAVCFSRDLAMHVAELFERDIAKGDPEAADVAKAFRELR